MYSRFSPVPPSITATVSFRLQTLLPNPFPRPHTSQTTLVFCQNMLVGKTIFFAIATANTAVCRIDGQFSRVTFLLGTSLLFGRWWESSYNTTGVAGGEGVGWYILERNVS